MDFSISRILQLIKRDLEIHSLALILFSIGISFSVILIMLASIQECDYPQREIKILDSVFFISFLMSGTILSSSIFTEFRHPTSTSLYLGIPASHFEKWFSRWIICVPAHILLSLAIILLTYNTMADIIYSTWPQCHFMSLSLTTREESLIALSTYLIFQSFCYFLGIFYNKHAPIKTLATVVILLGIGSFILTLIIKILYGAEYRGELRINMNLDVIAKISYSLTPLLWLASYYKLKEKQL